MDDFEERHGWSPDSDYDIIKSNLTPEEEAKEFERFMDEIGDDLQRAISEIEELETSKTEEE